ncbi:LOB domain-containing protein 22-like [Arachis stenosperma]|uniref:LOB domain-containing protein 22-like n=1 Tax=Arachis stenosperma TaxID=217475 RepID=UPI0025ACAA8E|nr:LOB domain-containing protein 22-like [Arachis stenosperma]
MSKKISTTSQACAACKHQRRKCGPNCILAPYFPHDRQKQFLNAHKLFGVGRMTDLIKPLGPTERNIAMETIIYESEMRAYDPVNGCCTMIQQLQSEIEYRQAELQLVLHRLALFKAQAQQQSSSCNQVNNVEGIPFQPDQYYEATNMDSNSSITHEVDLNAWMMQNLQSPALLSPLTLTSENENGNVGVDDNNGYIYDQKPMLDLGFKETKSNHQTPVEGMHYSGMKQIYNFQDQEQKD